MQGFSTSIRERYQDKWALSLTGEGPRKKHTVKMPLDTQSEKRSEKRKKRRRLSVVEKFSN